jgi:hypothetical protein
MTICPVLLLLLLLLLLLCFKFLEISLSARRHYLDALSSTMFLTVRNIVLPFWKLLEFAYQIEI